jgi:hypothetical protein
LKSWAAIRVPTNEDLESAARRIVAGFEPDDLAALVADWLDARIAI